MIIDWLANELTFFLLLGLMAQMCLFDIEMDLDVERTLASKSSLRAKWPEPDRCLYEQSVNRMTFFPPCSKSSQEKYEKWLLQEKRLERWCVFKETLLQSRVVVPRFLLHYCCTTFWFYLGFSCFVFFMFAYLCCNLGLLIIIIRLLFFFLFSRLLEELNEMHFRNLSFSLTGSAEVIFMYLLHKGGGTQTFWGFVWLYNRKHNQLVLVSVQPLGSSLAPTVYEHEMICWQYRGAHQLLVELFCPRRGPQLCKRI